MTTGNARTKWIKRSQKESILQREITTLLQEAALDDPRLRGFFVSRVMLSEDKSMCRVYFVCDDEKETIQSKLEILKLYKPSLRKALAQRIKARYIPDIRFYHDKNFAKQQELESILEQIKHERDNGDS